MTPSGASRAAIFSRRSVVPALAAGAGRRRSALATSIRSNGAPPGSANASPAAGRRTTTRGSPTVALRPKASAVISSKAGSSVETTTDVTKSCFRTSATTPASSPTTSARQGRRVRPSRGTWTSISRRAASCATAWRTPSTARARPNLECSKTSTSWRAVRSCRTLCMSKTMVRARPSLRSCHHAACGDAPAALTVLAWPGSHASRDRRSRALPP